VKPLGIQDKVFLKFQSLMKKKQETDISEILYPESPKASQQGSTMKNYNPKLKSSLTYAT